MVEVGASCTGVTDAYELQYSGRVNEVTPVFKYRSRRSGLRVVVAQVEGPLVSGFFCVATEANDDDGLPHTLEHLIFMGSEDYPFKGVLDLVANRCLSSGTNAWTDTDHTCYTMTTAGSDGFLKLMPLYLDHILYPTLKESAYITEVHHVNGSGEDVGVVYCEMQARENTGESRTHLEMLRAMYPGGCGYKSETGGIMENLRSSTSHGKVKNYHSEFYRPENLYLIVTGMVEPSEVLARLQKFEDKIDSKCTRSSYARPWQSPVPPLLETVEKTVSYPCDDEESGMVVMAWRGPLAKEQKRLSALLVLMEYLTYTSVSPMQRDFVELEEPYANDISYSIIENSESCFYFHFDNVPLGKLQEISPRLLTLFENLSQKKEMIDMKRMKSIIHRQILEAMSALEDAPHSYIAFHIIGEFLYGNTLDDMTSRLNQIDFFRQLETEPQDYWVDLLTSVFIGKKYVLILGQPSHELMERMSEAEKDRTEKQRTDLGPNGLETYDQQLKQAIEENERPAPPEMLTCVDVPDVGSIQFHCLKPSSNHGPPTAQSDCQFPLHQLPFTFQLDDITTNFVTISVLMDTDSVPYDLKPYLPLFLELILESPVERNGAVVPFEEVVTELAADTLSYSSSLGVGGSRFSCGNFSNVVMLTLKVEMDKYRKAVQWLRQLLYDVVFTEERMKIVANKMVNDVARMKRDGGTVVQAIMREINFSKGCNYHVSSMLRQHAFLSKLLESVEKNGEEKNKHLESLRKLREIVTRPSVLRVHMAAHVSRLIRHCDSFDPVEVWLKEFLPTGVATDGERPRFKLDGEFVKSDEMCPERSIIVGVGSVESNYLIQTAPGIRNFQDPDIPALRVCLSYLTQLEGPMWKQIRGLGLSYSYSLYIKHETGLIYFSLFKSTQLVEAFRQAKKLVDSLVDGSAELSDVELESAKSSLIFEIIEEEKTPANASLESMLSYFRGIPHDYSRSIIQRIPGVTKEDVRRVGRKYLASLFDPTKSRVAICCHPKKVEEISSAFENSLGRKFKVVESLEEAFLTEF